LAPETSSFKIYYEVTATTAGAKYFYNPIRKGSAASEEKVLDAMSGQPLRFEVVSGTEARKDPLMADADTDTSYIKVTLARVVVIPFKAVQKGQSIRLRIAETYTAPASYGLDGDELVFDRSLGRPRNAVVLPSGWYCSFSAIPATVSQQADGNVRLDYWDDRPEPVDVLLKARRRIKSPQPSQQ
jgi:hypothetical protein